MTITGNDHRFSVRQQFVECVQEFLLRSSLADQEIQIIDQQAVALSEVFAKSSELPEAHRLHEPVGKILGRYITNAPVRLPFPQTGIYAFQEMRLASTNGAMHDQRVGTLLRSLDDAQRRRMGHPVTRADDKIRQP